MIRPERPDEAAAIGQMITAAFRTAPHASGTEAAIVTGLRDAGALELSLVAETGGQILGHLALSAATIGGASGWKIVGPLAVAPQHQRRGIGRALMAQAIDWARATGVTGLTLVGDPAYYGRFGLRNWPGLTLPGVPDSVVLALPFDGRTPKGVLGFHPAFGA